MFLRICSLLLLAAPLLAQKPAPPTLEQALTDARTPLTISDGKLSGAGVGVLTQAIAESRFILLGEDHFSRETPQFAAALCDLIHPDAYAVEAGPQAARFVSTILRSSDRVARMGERGRTYPNNMAFLDIREENDLAAHCAAASRNPHFALWGLDQEFLGAAAPLLEAMQQTHPGLRSRAAIAATQAKDRQAETAARQSGKFDQLFLLAAADADIQPLQAAIAADGTPTTRKLLDEFTASRAIYQMNLKGLPDSNRVRARLLKQHFLADYLPFKAQSPEPHIFFKFGGMHTGKGFSFLHQRDLGNFVAELADAEHTQSLHIFAVGVRGTHTHPTAYGKPLTSEPFVMSDDPTFKWLTPAVSQILPPTTGTAFTMFDLRQLRFRRIVLPPEWQHIVDSYDLLVLIPEFTPATMIP